MLRESGTQIGTIRVQGRDEPDRQAIQRRIASRLKTVEFRIPGSPPSGVLIIRHLDDPLPGKLALHEREIKSHPAWEDALKSSLLEKYRNAFHPIRGYISPEAEAVFFADEGEMLATLALDIGRGLTASHWWWTVVLKNMRFPPEPDLNTFLGHEIILMPAILYHLAEWQTAAEVIAKLSSGQAFTLLRMLCQAFHLAEPSIPLFQIQPGIPDTVESFIQEDDHYQGPAMAPLKEEAIKENLPGNLKNPPPMDATQSLETVVKPPWQQLLSTYESQFHFSSQCAEHPALLGIGLSLFYAPANVRAASFTHAFHTWFLHERYEQKAEKSQPSTVDIHPVLTTISPGKERLNLNQSILEDPPSFIPSVSSVPSANSISFKDGKNSIPPTYLQEWTKSGLETELGGVFYLINLIKRLNLLGRFHESCSQSELNPWAILDILAKALLEDRYLDLETDPLWLVFNKLGGRELEIFPETLNLHVFSWIDKELAGIRAFLYDVLGAPSEDNPEPEKAMLLYPARVYITSTHIDIVMSLENISIPVRMAGLDRDPGWMPEYSRIILFHFV